MPPINKDAVLVLGARGFLGAQIVVALEATGRAVRTTPPGDLTVSSRAHWDGWLQGVSGVINAAGRTSGSLSEMTRANALLPAQMLEAMDGSDVKLVHLASAAEYGAVPQGHASHEDDPVRPLSPYGASKLAGTILIEEAVRSGRVRAVALRLTNPLGVGIGAGTLPGRAACELKAAAQEGRSVARFGPLGAHRDFVDARDVARAAVFALGTDLSGTVNVGSGQARPVRDLVNGLATLTGFKGKILEDAPSSPRSSDVPYQCADLTRLHVGGFTLIHSFEDSLEAIMYSSTTVISHLSDQRK